MTRLGNAPVSFGVFGTTGGSASPTVMLTALAAAKPTGQGGVAAPAAKRFGHVTPTRAAHVQAELLGGPTDGFRAISRQAFAGFR